LKPNRARRRLGRSLELVSSRGRGLAAHERYCDQETWEPSSRAIGF
jgi:hypothetical protein